jgi:lysozyme
MVMKISENGLDLIRKYEGLRLEAYICPAGILTIGYGHTGSDVTAGLKIDNAQADALLSKDVERFEKSVNDLVKVPMTQGMFDSLVCFAFNLGAGSLKSSTLLTKINANDAKGAADEFLRWNKAGGKVLAGLTARRESERGIFLS